MMHCSPLTAILVGWISFLAALIRMPKFAELLCCGMSVWYGAGAVPIIAPSMIVVESRFEACIYKRISSHDTDSCFLFFAFHIFEDKRRHHKIRDLAFSYDW